MGHCQVLPTVCPLQAETAVVGSQQRLPCRFIGTVTMEQKTIVDGFLDSLHSIQIPHACRQGPSTYEVMLSDHPQQSMVLMRCGLPRSLGLAGTKVPVAACLRGMPLTVARVTPIRPAIALCCMPLFVTLTFDLWPWLFAWTSLLSLVITPENLFS